MPKHFKIPYRNVNFSKIRKFRHFMSYSKFSKCSGFLNFSFEVFNCWQFANFPKLPDFLKFSIFAKFLEFFFLKPPRSWKVFKTVHSQNWHPPQRRIFPSKFPQATKQFQKLKFLANPSNSENPQILEFKNFQNPKFPDTPTNRKF